MSTEKPILFSAPMVRAILAGTKTQTRRMVKPQPIHDKRFLGGWKLCNSRHEASVVSPLIAELCPYGEPGTRLWVREKFAIVPRTAYARSDGVHQTLRPGCDHDAAIYGAEWCRSKGGFRWRPSIHMPRWASRIDLLITRVWVERLQDISEADAIAEGAPGGHGAIPGYGYSATPQEHYGHLWEQINGAGSWEDSPWVWRIEFERIKP